MIDSMKVKRSIYFATLQGYVIFETELYILYLFIGMNPHFEEIRHIMETYKNVDAQTIYIVNLH